MRTLTLALALALALAPPLTPTPAPTLTLTQVQPQCGAVLCFPQGNTASLVHEGSGVTRGAKYVIRTDVVYRPCAS